MGTATDETIDQVGFYADNGFEPASYKEAMACPDHDRWQEAMEIEMKGLDRLQVFELCDRSRVPKNSRIIKSRWVFKIKPEKYKARVVIKGFLQAARDIGETFSPTVKMVTLRLIFALAAVMGWLVRQMSVTHSLTLTLAQHRSIWSAHRDTDIVTRC